ncbi:HAD family hydrolase [Streptomyces sp. NPDC001663]|uniref:HAD family hydrolase n=1 Tax=Streptomyces sp. NPDC001663 TaxID=3364597 RepID=UPI003692F54C
MAVTGPMDDALDEQQALRRLLESTQAVLLDFDGPVTDLFKDISTEPIADEIKGVVRRLWGALDQDVDDSKDSHGILQRLRDMYDRPSPAPRGREALKLAEDIVTRHESAAVETAAPTPHVTRLVTALRQLPRRLAIVGNNAAAPVRRFLELQGLQKEFEAVLGRDPNELRHMKPDPDCLNRAVEHLGLAPSECLFIGDQLTDLQASLAAGTRFLGYDPTTKRAPEMRRLGAVWVVQSHEPLITTTEVLLHPNRRSVAG